MRARASVAFVRVGSECPEFDGREIALHQLHDLVFARAEYEQELRVYVVDDAGGSGSLWGKPLWMCGKF